MGRPFFLLLSEDKVYACGNCRNHLAAGSETVSKHFYSRSGRAYLFRCSYNVQVGPPETRMMTTGRHVVCDLHCAQCLTCVGWQYVFAHEDSQKYKEGMCVLERAMVVDYEKTSPACRLHTALSRGREGASTGGSRSSGEVLYAADDSGSEGEG